MKIGIKFCGGCNPRYNRKLFVEQLIAAHPSDFFSYAEESEHYDILLLVCGCTSCCASYEQYSFDRIIKISDNMKDPL